MHDHHIVRGARRSLDPARQAVRTVFMRRAHFLQIEFEIRSRYCLAKQYQSGFPLSIAETQGTAIRIIDLASFETRLAQAAVSTPTAMWQVPRRLQGSVQHRLVAGCFEVPARIDYPDAHFTLADCACCPATR